VGSTSATSAAFASATASTTSPFPLGGLCSLNPSYFFTLPAPTSNEDRSC
jgi:hypothetical protein